MNLNQGRNVRQYKQSMQDKYNTRIVRLMTDKTHADYRDYEVQITKTTR